MLKVTSEDIGKKSYKNKNQFIISLVFLFITMQQLMIDF